MIQKSLRGLTPTTFLLTPQALSATLLLKMNREVFNVAQMDDDWGYLRHPAALERISWMARASGVLLFSVRPWMAIAAVLTPPKPTPLAVDVQTHPNTTSDLQ